jgi:hypothetical protein
MKIIIIEDTAYKISNKEQTKLSKMQAEIKEVRYPECDALDRQLDAYLTKAKKEYTRLGVVSFDYRL